jgi:hypothetical protein
VPSIYTQKEGRCGHRLDPIHHDQLASASFTHASIHPFVHAHKHKNKRPPSARFNNTSSTTTQDPPDLGEEELAALEDEIASPPLLQPAALLRQPPCSRAVDFEWSGGACDMKSTAPLGYRALPSP